VDIASDITGRIIEIPVEEGQTVSPGDLLLRIDPTQFEAQVQRAEATLSTNRANAIQARVNRDQAKRALDRSLQLRNTDPNLVSDEQLELIQQSYDVAVANMEAQEYQVAQAQATLREANEQLGKTILRAPMAGKITRLAVEQGEVALASTFSRETGLLMTISDLSVIQINVRVDETDVVRVAEGDSAEVTIDAFPDTTFAGRVTKISQSAIQAAAGGSGDRAVDYDVEVRLDNPPPDIRPDLSGTARVITDTRDAVPAIPIIALTVREHAGLITENRTAADTSAQDTEGVFVVESGVAYFRPVRVGIAGEEHFEVLSGISEGDSIVAGPYQTIRDLDDSTAVRPTAPEDGPRRAITRAPRTGGHTTQALASERPTPPAGGQTAVGDSGPAPLPIPPDTAAGRGAFAVQVAALESRAAADEWAARLRAAGYEVDVLAAPDGLYKVQVGPLATRAESEALARVLREQFGERPFIVSRS
jgi:HlyD family secretion protein